MRNELTLFDLPEPTGKKSSYKKPADVKVNRINREVAKRRYYLHKCLSDDFVLFAAERKIKCEYERFEAIPVGQRYYVGQLIAMGYEVQFKLNI